MSNLEKPLDQVIPSFGQVGSILRAGPIFLPMYRGAPLEAWRDLELELLQCRRQHFVYIRCSVRIVFFSQPRHKIFHCNS